MVHQHFPQNGREFLHPLVSGRLFQKAFRPDELPHRREGIRKGRFVLVIPRTSGDTHFVSPRMLRKDQTHHAEKPQEPRPTPPPLMTT